MAIVLQCPCGRKLQIKDEYAGQEGQCPACGRTLSIPRAADDDAPLPSVRPVAVARAEDPAPPPRPTARPVPRRRDDDGEDQAPDLRDLSNHGDGPLPAAADFFAPAPRAIGQLRSAWTTLREGKRPLNPGLRWLLIFAVFVGSILLGVGVVIVCQPDDVLGGADPARGGPDRRSSPGPRRASTTPAPTSAATASPASSASAHGENLTTHEVFLFRDAVDLRTAQTHYYRNGVYQNTSFAFTWYDVGGRKRYVINGTHNSQNNTPPPTHYFHFARAAEFAWTVYLLDDVDRQMQLSGSIPFQLTNGQWIRLGKGFLTLGLSEQPVELDAADVGAVQVQKGVVRIKRVDAEEGWFSSRGVYKFDFAQPGQRPALLSTSLNKLVGVRVV